MAPLDGLPNGHSSMRARSPARGGDSRKHQYKTSFSSQHDDDFLSTPFSSTRKPLLTMNSISSRNVTTMFGFVVLALIVFYTFSSAFTSSPHPTLGGDLSRWARERQSSTHLKKHTNVPSNLRAVQNETLGFEKIFVLNMPERTDKRDALTLAASLSNLSFEFAAGVRGFEMIDKALPHLQEDRGMGDTYLGSWRGHMNIIRSIVENKMSSALILEDDMDWDLRLKDQAVDFAKGVRYFLNTTETARTHSPYGDGWDVLWMGKCQDGWWTDKEVPDASQRQLYTIQDDMTVPLLTNLRVKDGQDMLWGFTDRTRLVHRAERSLCTFAYAVSLQGARKILYKLSVNGLAYNFDNSLSWFCSDVKREYNQQCFTATPTYFHQHRVRGKASKNSDQNSDELDVEDEDEPSTYAIRQSTRMNLDRILKGKTTFRESYADDVKPGRQGRAAPTLDEIEEKRKN